MVVNRVLALWKILSGLGAGQFWKLHTLWPNHALPDKDLNKCSWFCQCLEINPVQNMRDIHTLSKKSLKQFYSETIHFPGMSDTFFFRHPSRSLEKIRFRSISPGFSMGSSSCSGKNTSHHWQLFWRYLKAPVSALKATILWEKSGGENSHRSPSLKLTAKTLKMDGTKTISLPFGAQKPYFQGQTRC